MGQKPSKKMPGTARVTIDDLSYEDAFFAIHQHIGGDMQEKLSTIKYDQEAKKIFIRSLSHVLFMFPNGDDIQLKLVLQNQIHAVGYVPCVNMVHYI
jgi:hypothetical protein